MKILQLSNKFPFPLRDGGTIATFTITKGLSELGHEITMLTMSTPKHQYSENSIKNINNLKIENVYVNTNIQLIKAFLNFFFSKKPYNTIRFISKEYSIQLINLLKKNSFDIIQLEGLYLTPYIKIIRQYSETIISYRAHNIEHEIWTRYSHTISNPLKRFYLKIMAKRLRRFELEALNSYDLLIPITSRDADKLNYFGNTKPLHVCPAGIEIKDKSTMGINNKAPTLFYIGSLDWMPNQEGINWFLKYIWPALNQQFPTIGLYIAGRNAPEWMVKNMNVTNCHYQGEVNDAGKFMESHSIMVAPLFSGSGMRVKVIEAMSYGKTVVTTSIGAEGLNTTHRENIIIADTIKDFVNEIVFLINHPAEYRKIGRNARKFVEINFDNSRIISDLEKFYYKNLEQS
jgi:polysaccharide biosynthesis protein PslH